MIITLIFLMFAVVGIVLASVRLDNYKTEDIINFIGAMLMILGILFSCTCFAVIIGQVSAREIDYQNTLYEKEMLEYRIEHMEQNITGNEMLYSDIVEFNNELRRVKKWANNPWTNWFNNQKVATIDYIELDMD